MYMDRRAREGVEQREPQLGENRRLGAINLALDAAALVGAGVTVYLYVTRPTEVSRRSARITPWVVPGESVGFAVQGSL
jgi:hypothetical protein